MNTRAIAATLGLGLVGALTTAAVVSERAATSSSCTGVLDAEVCAWVVTEDGRVTELGATIPMRLIESVPTGGEMVWPPRPLATVRLPEAAREALGIDHMGVNWEAHGHPPAAFLTEHFDFHFYNITEAEVAAIDCADVSKPAALSSGYALPDIEVPGMGTFVGLCVPAMGMHAMLAAEVDDTDAFSADMLLGYYAGRPIFFEPMVSRELLLSGKDFTLAVPHVADLPSGVRYPRALRAEYDETAEEYRLVFTGFGVE